ncbi:MAG: hypothetical protein AAF378_13865 [Cyanobacteria bacterium P01_A01_bin.84]
MVRCYLRLVAFSLFFIVSPTSKTLTRFLLFLNFPSAEISICLLEGVIEEHGVGLPTLELIADDFVYVRLMTRSNPEINDIIQAKERRGKKGFAEFFVDLFANVDLQFGDHEFLYGDSVEAVVLFPFTKFKIRATGVDVTSKDVACYDRFVFDEDGKLKKWYPLLSRTFTHSEFYGSASGSVK